MNLGAQKVRAAAGADATIADIAAELGIDRTYCGRILSDERTPGLHLRKRAFERYGVEYADWDHKVPDPEQLDQATSPTDTLS